MSIQLSAQCDDLFFSEYVEGYANNKALEIYNPTSEAINLSDYSILRFSNGATTVDELYTTTLPDVMLESYDVYVIVVDLTDTADWNTQFDKPAWNGYNLIDTLFDQVTGLPIMDDDGNVVFGPQYSEDGAALFGDEYNEEYDLQCKADVFLNPDYDTNRTMYFNGNDAMVLISGTEVSSDGSNIIDVIGVIGENPENTIMQDAWVNEDGFWLTKNSTLIRRPDVTGGRNALSDVVFSQGGTFTGEEWIDTWNNSFEYLQIHQSVCNSESTVDVYSCITGPGTNTNDLNAVAFNLFPNPTQGTFNINAEEDMHKIQVFNMIGQLVYHKSLNSPVDNLEIDLQDLHSGMYLINIHFGKNQLSNTRLIKE